MMLKTLHRALEQARKQEGGKDGGMLELSIDESVGWREGGGGLIPTGMYCGCGWRSWDRSSEELTEIPLRF
eukprot:COSAG01_NODE_1095_length_11714_cov_9.062930_17_plen_71_part_00